MLRITIFRRAPAFLPPLLITPPRKAVKTFMKLTGPGTRFPGRPIVFSLAAAQSRKISCPVPEAPHLNNMPSGRVSPMIDSMLSCTELMKHAEHCGLDCTADVEPHRRVECHLLLDQQIV